MLVLAAGRITTRLHGDTLTAARLLSALWSVSEDTVGDLLFRNVRGVEFTASTDGVMGATGRASAG